MALHIRGRRSSAARDPEGRMSIVEHLEDLRRALIVALIGWLAVTIVGFIFWRQILEFLIYRAGLQKTGLIFLAPTGAFMIGLKIAFVVGLVGAAPIIFWQLWWFISPGLHVHEKRLILPLIAATSFFFLVGISFSLYALGLIMKVLTSFAPPDLRYLPDGNELLGFILLITLAFGMVFELPVVLYTLGRLGIVSSRWLYHTRAYWVIGLGILANFMTPGADPLTPLLVFIPLMIFWEGTALLLKLTGR